MWRSLAGCATALVAISPSFAQYDPGASRAENQVNAINRSIARQQQDRAAQQQNQFEINSLRNELSRPAAPMVPAPGFGPLSPPLR